MRWLARRLPFATAIPVASVFYVGLCETASAHVKWFCAYNVAGQPDGLENVLCLDFEFLTGLSILGLMAGSLLEGTPVGVAMLQALDRVTAFIRNNLETIFRASVAFFFIAIWGVGGVLLTPELKTDSTLIGIIQLGIAAGMISRRTMPLSALGICALYAVAIWNYGVFHLADYPVFLGIAAYLALTGLQKNFFGARPIDVVRWAAGITLMWASIEKWAYPEWSYPLFVAHPEMSMGFMPDFFMRAAGAVEFALAFALIWTPLVRRAGAAMLAAMFISAVFEFGKIDLIGHTLIVVALFGIVADDARQPARLRDSWLLPLSYAAALVLFLAVYYVGHAELFGTAIL
jgi:small basic protein